MYLYEIFNAISFCRFGPLVRHWTMRFEAKHNYLKKLAQNLGNFINISWTLANRHQQWLCYKWLDSEALGQENPEVGPGIYSKFVVSHEIVVILYVNLWCYIHNVYTCII